MTSFVFNVTTFLSKLRVWAAKDVFKESERFIGAARALEIAWAAVVAEVPVDVLEDILQFIGIKSFLKRSDF